MNLPAIHRCLQAFHASERHPANFVSSCNAPGSRLGRFTGDGVSTGCGGFPTASHWGHEPLPVHGGSPVHSPLLHQNTSGKHHNTLLHQNTRAPVGSTIIHFYSSTPEHRHNSPFSSWTGYCPLPPCSAKIFVHYVLDNLDSMLAVLNEKKEAKKNKNQRKIFRQ